MKPSDFHVNLHELMCVEIFAGCAQLSASLKQAGFSVLPIDHQKGKTLKAKLMLLDNGKHCLLPLRTCLRNRKQSQGNPPASGNGTPAGRTTT